MEGGDDHPLDTDTEKRKRRFRPFEAFRKLFRSNRKGDKSSAGKSASSGELRQGDTTTDDDDDDGGFSTHKSKQSRLVNTRSKSNSEHDIFSSAQRSKGNVKRFPRSAVSNEGINKVGIQTELSQKLSKRRSLHSVDDGLPISPGSSFTTADLIMGQALKGSPAKSASRDSDRSLLSIDGSENEEEDLFGRTWTSSVVSVVKKDDAAHRHNLAMSLDLDLGAVAQTTGLNTSLAKHRIAVKPQLRRLPLRAQKRVSMASALPQLKEESPGRGVTRPTSIAKPPAEKKLDSTPEAQKLIKSPSSPPSAVIQSPTSTTIQQSTPSTAILSSSPPSKSPTPPSKPTLSPTSTGKVLQSPSTEPSTKVDIKTPSTEKTPLSDKTASTDKTASADKTPSTLKTQSTEKTPSTDKTAPDKTLSTEKTPIVYTTPSHAATEKALSLSATDKSSASKIAEKLNESPFYSKTILTPTPVDKVDVTEPTVLLDKSATKTLPVKDTSQVEKDAVGAKGLTDKRIEKTSTKPIDVPVNKFTDHGKISSPKSEIVKSPDKSPDSFHEYRSKISVREDRAMKIEPSTISAADKSDQHDYVNVLELSTEGLPKDKNISEVTQEKETLASVSSNTEKDIKVTSISGRKNIYGNIQKFGATSMKLDDSKTVDVSSKKHVYDNVVKRSSGSFESTDTKGSPENIYDNVQKRDTSVTKLDAKRTSFLGSKFETSKPDKPASKIDTGKFDTKPDKPTNKIDTSKFDTKTDASSKTDTKLYTTASHSSEDSGQKSFTLPTSTAASPPKTDKFQRPPRRKTLPDHSSSKTDTSVGDASPPKTKISDKGRKASFPGVKTPQTSEKSSPDSEAGSPSWMVLAKRKREERENGNGADITSNQREMGKTEKFTAANLRKSPDERGDSGSSGSSRSSPEENRVDNTNKDIVHIDTANKDALPKIGNVKSLVSQQADTYKSPSSEVKPTSITRKSEPMGTKVGGKLNEIDANKSRSLPQTSTPPSEPPRRLPRVSTPPSEQKPALPARKPSLPANKPRVSPVSSNKIPIHDNKPTPPTKQSPVTDVQKFSVNKNAVSSDERKVDTSTDSTTDTKNGLSDTKALFEQKRISVTKSNSTMSKSPPDIRKSAFTQSKSSSLDTSADPALKTDDKTETSKGKIDMSKFGFNKTFDRNEKLEKTDEKTKPVVRYGSSLTRTTDKQPKIDDAPANKTDDKNNVKPKPVKKYGSDLAKTTDEKSTKPDDKTQTQKGIPKYGSGFQKTVDIKPVDKTKPSEQNPASQTNVDDKPTDTKVPSWRSNLTKNSLNNNNDSTKPAIISRQTKPLTEIPTKQETTTTTKKVEPGNNKNEGSKVELRGKKEDTDANDSEKSLIILRDKVEKKSDPSSRSSVFDMMKKFQNS